MFSIYLVSSLEEEYYTYNKILIPKFFHVTCAKYKLKKKDDFQDIYTICFLSFRLKFCAQAIVIRLRTRKFFTCNIINRIITRLIEH